MRVRVTRRILDIKERRFDLYRGDFLDGRSLRLAVGGRLQRMVEQFHPAIKVVRETSDIVDAFSLLIYVPANTSTRTVWREY